MAKTDSNLHEGYQCGSLLGLFFDEITGLINSIQRLLSGSTTEATPMQIFMKMSLAFGT